MPTYRSTAFPNIAVFLALFLAAAVFASLQLGVVTKPAWLAVDIVASLGLLGYAVLRRDVVVSPSPAVPPGARLPVLVLFFLIALGFVWHMHATYAPFGTIDGASEQYIATMRTFPDGARYYPFNARLLTPLLAGPLNVLPAADIAALIVVNFASFVMAGTLLIVLLTRLGVSVFVAPFSLLFFFHSFLGTYGAQNRTLTDPLTYVFYVLCFIFAAARDLRRFFWIPLTLGVLTSEKVLYWIPAFLLIEFVERRRGDSGRWGQFVRHLGLQVVPALLLFGALWVYGTTREDALTILTWAPDRFNLLRSEDLRTILPLGVLPLIAAIGVFRVPLALTAASLLLVPIYGQLVIESDFERMFAYSFIVWVPIAFVYLQRLADRISLVVGYAVAIALSLAHWYDVEVQGLALLVVLYALIGEAAPLVRPWLTPLLRKGVAGTARSVALAGHTVARAARAARGVVTRPAVLSNAAFCIALFLLAAVVGSSHLGVVTKPYWLAFDLALAAGLMWYAVKHRDSLLSPSPTIPLIARVPVIVLFFVLSIAFVWNMHAAYAPFPTIDGASAQYIDTMRSFPWGGRYYPFNARLLTPLLAGPLNILPAADIDALIVVNYASFALAGTLLVVLLARLGVSVFVAPFALLFFFHSFLGSYGAQNRTLVDPLTYVFFLACFILAADRDLRRYFWVPLTLGVLTSEKVLYWVPVFLLIEWIDGRTSRDWWRRALAQVAPAAGLFAVLFVYGVTRQDAATVFAWMPGRLASLLSEDPRVVLPFGVLPLIAAIGLLRVPGAIKAAALLLVPIYAQLVIESDVERMLAYGFIVWIPLAFVYLARLADRLPFLVGSLAAITFSVAHWFNVDWQRMALFAALYVIAAEAAPRVPARHLYWLKGVLLTAARPLGRMGRAVQSRALREARHAWVLTQRPVVRLSLVLSVLVVAHAIQMAWLCDDAFITYRSVINVVHGYGLTYNITERVQSFTNPLFIVIMSAATWFSGEVIYTPLVLSLVYTAAAVLIVLFALGKDSIWVPIVLLAMLLSKAFIEWSTGGLENPMSNLVLALAVWAYVRQQPDSLKDFAIVSLCVSLVFINRHDLAVIVLPLFLLAAWKCCRPRNIIRGALIGAVPAVLWLAFSTLYYGFPFPNTAYAKLGAWLDSGYYSERGIRYFYDSFYRDGITLPFTILAVALAAWSRRVLPVALCAGVLLYYVYIVRIGGDFMSGRFLSAPFFLACLSLLFLDLRKSTAAVTLAVAVLAFGVYRGNIPFALPTNPLNEHGPDDIRLYYKNTYGWSLDAETGGWPPVAEWPAAPDYSAPYLAQSMIKGVAVAGSLGDVGLIAGPHVYLIDYLALTDPLLARLPALSPRRYGIPRVGHLIRAIPAGYVETRQTGRTAIVDPGLAEYYDRLQTVISENVWDPRRWTWIWQLNGGRQDYLIDKDVYRNPEHINPAFITMFDGESGKRTPMPEANWGPLLESIAKAEAAQGH